MPVCELSRKAYALCLCDSRCGKRVINRGDNGRRGRSSHLTCSHYCYLCRLPQKKAVS